MRYGLANRIGYPVVIKPVDGRQGQGVTAGVTSEEEVVVAFPKRMPSHLDTSSSNDLSKARMFGSMSFCGQFAYAVLRSPPRWWAMACIR